MPQTPYAREKVVAEIVGQLRNWNIETHQNGGVTSSQGGFDFNVGGQRTIRAPDVSFTPKQTDRERDKNHEKDRYDIGKTFFINERRRH
ncbi:hypothetical protein RirG_011890 [Rhizophagus irregularis DAOM 197198w]|uniref:Uncharacterized protein n=1 Tax=Rhizophagus irregularis (strain DAOM 197198w) TaxID=1432141 RepID=A0A015M1D2_RHIIW|nr:hypothetical protein RirG_011890 [Rhizophagus irregularis DAOM 197198w]